MEYKLLLIILLTIALGKESLSDGDTYEDLLSAAVARLFICRDELEENGMTVEIIKCVKNMKEEISLEVCQKLSTCVAKGLNLMTENGTWNKTEINKYVKVSETDYKELVKEYRTNIEPVCLNMPGLDGELIIGFIKCALEKSNTLKSYFEQTLKDLNM